MDTQRIDALLQKAPSYYRFVKSCLEKDGIDNPAVDDYISISDSNQLYGISEILREVIGETEGLELNAYIDSANGLRYLLYTPKCPWKMPEAEKSMTEKDFTNILTKYVKILTDTDIPIREYTICR